MKYLKDFFLVLQFNFSQPISTEKLYSRNLGYDICTEDKKSKNNCPVSVVVDKYTSLVMYNDDHNHGTVQSKTKMLAIIKNAVITSDVKTRKVLAEITTIVQNTEVTSMGSIPKKEQKIDWKPADPKNGV